MKKAEIDCHEGVSPSAQARCIGAHSENQFATAAVNIVLMALTAGAYLRVAVVAIGIAGLAAQHYPSEAREALCYTLSCDHHAENCADRRPPIAALLLIAFKEPTGVLSRT
jgi:hypothetical protein